MLAHPPFCFCSMLALTWDGDGMSSRYAIQTVRRMEQISITISQHSIALGLVNSYGCQWDDVVLDSRSANNEPSGVESKSYTDEG